MRIVITGGSEMLGIDLISCLLLSQKEFPTSRSIGAEVQIIDLYRFDLIAYVLLNQWLEKSYLNVIVYSAAIVNVDLYEENVSATNLHVVTTEVIENYINSIKGRLINILSYSAFDGEKQRAYI